MPCSSNSKARAYDWSVCETGAISYIPADCVNERIDALEVPYALMPGYAEKSQIRGDLEDIER
jgi:hypothetical protein